MQWGEKGSDGKRSGGAGLGRSARCHGNGHYGHRHRTFRGAMTTDGTFLHYILFTQTFIVAVWKHQITCTVGPKLHWQSGTTLSPVTTRKPCCRKETARCRSFSFRFNLSSRDLWIGRLRSNRIRIESGVTILLTDWHDALVGISPRTTQPITTNRHLCRRSERPFFLSGVYSEFIPLILPG